MSSTRRIVLGIIALLGVGVPGHAAGAVPTVGLVDLSVLEGDSGPNDADVVVTLDRPSALSVTVDYASVDGTAHAGTDYTAVAGTVVFAPGVTHQTITVPILGDLETEPDEAFTISLGAASNATVGPSGTAQVTIVNDESRWQTLRTGPVDLAAIAFNGKAYVAVGSNGQIWRSLDGISWTRRFNPDPTFHPLGGIAWGGGQFVAVGAWGDYFSHGAILTSSNGRHWTLRDARVPDPAGQWANLGGVAYGNGLYVAVGGSGGKSTIITSPDAITWTERVATANQPLNAVAFGAGAFVAVGVNGTVLRSTNGSTWSAVTLPPGVPAGTHLSGITHTGTQFVVAGPSASLLTSPDGLVWTERPAPSGSYAGVAVGGGLIVAVGVNVATSADGVTWTAAPVDPPSPGVSPSPSAVVYGSRFVSVGNRGAIYTSETGSSQWTARTAEGSRYLSGVASLRSVDCAVDNGGAVVRSTDGSTWTNQADAPLSPYFPLTAITRGAGMFVAITNASTVMTSTDCASWVDHGPSGLARRSVYLYLTHANGLFVAAGYTYTSTWVPVIATSSDGLTWTPQATGVPDDGVPREPFTVAGGGGMFVVIGYTYTNGSQFSLTSPDAVNWTMRAVPFDTNSYAKLVFRAGTFVSVAGRLWSSEDGINWTARYGDPLNGPYTGLLWFTTLGTGPAGFVAADSYGRVGTSPDGHVWTVDKTPLGRSFNAIGYSRVSRRLLGVGPSLIAALPLP